MPSALPASNCTLILPEVEHDGALYQIGGYPQVPSNNDSPLPEALHSHQKSTPEDDVKKGIKEGIEDTIFAKASALLEALGDAVPALHETVLDQAERGLFKAVLAHTNNHLGRASKILGLDRNTCARKARIFGLVDSPSRGRKPAKKSAANRRPSSRKEATKSQKK